MTSCSVSIFPQSKMVSWQRSDRNLRSNILSTTILETNSASDKDTPISMLLWTTAAVPVLIWSIRGEQVERRKDPHSSVVMAAITSVLFAATLLPLPVPVVGATSHICLTPLFALLVGVRRMVWPTFFILLLQALFFAHGGLIHRCKYSYPDFDLWLLFVFGMYCKRFV